MTVKDILDKAEKTRKSVVRPGSVILDPPVNLLYKRTGSVVSARSVDVNGKYPNTVHTTELGFWYPVENFEFPK